MMILVYLVQASCNTRTLVPLLSGQSFYQYPDKIPVSSGQDDIYFFILLACRLIVISGVSRHMFYRRTAGRTF